MDEYNFASIVTIIKFVNIKVLLNKRKYEIKYEKR